MDKDALTQLELELRARRNTEISLLCLLVRTILFGAGVTCLILGVCLTAGTPLRAVAALGFISLPVSSLLIWVVTAKELITKSQWDRFTKSRNL